MLTVELTWLMIILGALTIDIFAVPVRGWYSTEAPPTMILPLSDKTSSVLPEVAMRAAALWEYKAHARDRILCVFLTNVEVPSTSMNVALPLTVVAVCVLPTYVPPTE